VEAEQWTQVQDVLKHVCTEMATLQQACQGWEQRALNAEFQAAACQLEVICCELLPVLASSSFEFAIGLLGDIFSFIAEDIYYCLIRHEKEKEKEIQCTVYTKEFFTVVNTVIGVLSKVFTIQ
jgi:Na+(H+)/acetate symporter ActP